jgi:hypothetical protein
VTITLTGRTLTTSPSAGRSFSGMTTITVTG